MAMLQCTVLNLPSIKIFRNNLEQLVYIMSRCVEFTIHIYIH